MNSTQTGGAAEIDVLAINVQVCKLNSRAMKRSRGEEGWQRCAAEQKLLVVEVGIGR
jgi:hypothetical protein